MKKDKYILRIIDTIIKEYLGDFTAIYLRGPKWCGKTYTFEHFANSEIKMNTKRRIRSDVFRKSEALS
ncbi:MAG: hypothetical protein SPJ51_05690 [Candidatus Enterosoma sp.]|nr:hypothetical protein [bacterium]MDY5910276.1 hypothetical protein [Candidatus Enterosoma sp.]